MATANQNVTADALISATDNYSTKDDDARAYDISANVNIQNKNVTSFDNGEVFNPTDGGRHLANFSSYSDKSISINVPNSDEEEAKETLSAIYAFMKDVRANVNANPVNA